MTFKLGEQLDSGANPDLSFKLYASYIENNQRKFPEGVLNIIANPDWSGGSPSKAPYYSHLDSIKIENIGKPTAMLTIKLFKHMYVEKPFFIELSYHGLFKFDIPNQNNIYQSDIIWRYEQFLVFDGYQSHKSQEKFFAHQIEWVTGEVWTIIAKEFSAQWINL